MLIPHEVLAGAALSALAAIACDWRRRLKPFYLFKPLTTALVITAAFASTTTASFYGMAVAVGLVFCMLGDIALMGSGDRAFMAGLGSFLIGHLMFVAAFLSGLRKIAPGAHALVGAVFGLAGLVILMPRAGKLRLPVLAYIMVLLAMWLAADARFTQFVDGPSRLALLGASVFIASDSLLAWDRFVGRLPLAQPLILGTYYPAIMLIAMSV